MKRTAGAPGGRGGALALLLGALTVLVTACSGGGGATAVNDDGKPVPPGPGGTAVSTAVVTVLPGDGATGVATTGALRVSVSGGRLTTVVVRDDKGAVVPGAVSADGQEWTPAGHLDTATAYTVDASAEDGSGRESDKHAAFTTVVPRDTFVGFTTPEDGSTVGVGMEVYLHFNRPISDRRAVEAGVRVTAAPAVPVAAKWNGDQDLYLRPEKYWAAGTKVTVALDLAGVRGAPGVYGKQRKQVRFTVGRSQISVVDVARHTMTVYRDGTALRTLPVSAGGPDHTTYNGTMVISEKYLRTRMNGDTVGFGGEYDIPDVPHAMRLTTSGTFILGNYWAARSVFGRADTSHGCVGLSDVRGAGDPATPAAWFYDRSILGDVVRVVNSRDRTVQWYNGLNGWNLTWSQWTG